MSYIKRALIAVDQAANAVLGPVLNIVMKPSSDAEFGKPDETISSVMGKNVEKGSCRGCKLVCKVLHWFDSEHCKKSIEGDE